VEGQESNRETQQDRQTQDQAGGQQDRLFERPVSCAKPMFAQKRSLVAAAKVFKSWRGRLDVSAREFADGARGRVEHDHNHEKTPR